MFIAVMAALMLTCCSFQDEKSTRQMGGGPVKLNGTPATLTTEAARVLGFEDPVAYWTLVGGTSTEHTQEQLRVQ